MTSKPAMNIQRLCGILMYLIPYASQSTVDAPCPSLAVRDYVPVLAMCCQLWPGLALNQR